TIEILVVSGDLWGAAGHPWGRTGIRVGIAQQNRPRQGIASAACVRGALRRQRDHPLIPVDRTGVG
ncbi:MAG: hypothetical protein OEQ13_13870, partial [Acidobacteriota bacterium]|nr:hypothetical protein [Acidobacteriota bacterium]